MLVELAGQYTCSLLHNASLVNLQDNNSQTPTTTRKAKDANSDNLKDGLAYSCLLKNELLSAGIEDLKEVQVEERKVLYPKETRNLFRVSEIRF